MRQDVKENTPTRVIGVHLGRPEGGVRAKAQELGIKPQADKPSASGHEGKEVARHIAKCLSSRLADLNGR